MAPLLPASSHPPAMPTCLPSSLQADAQRATARDAFRADQKSEAKSAAWHAKVATAQAVSRAACPACRAAGAATGRSCLQACPCMEVPTTGCRSGSSQAAAQPTRAAPLQAHEALREAREDLYRLQALAELLAKELQRRRVAGGGLGSGGASPPMAAGGEGGASGGGGALAVEERLLAPPAPQGTKRKRGAPPEECPYCCHSYTGAAGFGWVGWVGVPHTDRLIASHQPCRPLQAPRRSLPAVQCETACRAAWTPPATACTCAAASAARRRRPAGTPLWAGWAAAGWVTRPACLVGRGVPSSFPLTRHRSLLALPLPDRHAGTAPSASSGPM